MVDADDRSVGLDQVREDVCQVSGPRADVEDSDGPVQKRKERFTGGGVHVRGGDGGAETDGLRGVFIRGAGCVVSSIDLDGASSTR